MSAISKKLKRAAYISKCESIFKCPICSSPMKLWECKSLVCTHHSHTFDLTKQGYVNFLKKPVKSRYGTELFEARRKLMSESDFFAPLLQAIANIIISRQARKESLTILDMGCGEGSHLSALSDRISFELGKSVTAAGIDISKEGILTASKNLDDKIWAVADLADTPFQDRQFDVILSIFSPSNYAECSRLLNEGGLMIKVLPQRDYLKELRQYFFADTEKHTYSNTGMIDRFIQNHQVVNQERLRYTKNLSQPALESLVQMTPLTWSSSKEKINQFLQKESSDITVDADILVGSKQM